MPEGRNNRFSVSLQSVSAREPEKISTSFDKYAAKKSFNETFYNSKHHPRHWFNLGPLATPRVVNFLPVPLLENGLVNLDELTMYMHRNPRSVPIARTPGWHYHHVNHRRTKWRPLERERVPEDGIYIIQRDSPYQQLHLRGSKEEIFHNYHEIDVPRPAFSVSEKVVNGLNTITTIGALSLGLAIIKGNHGDLNIDRTSLRAWQKFDADPIDAVEFLEETRDECAHQLEQNTVLPHNLVGSALKRIAIHLRDDKYLSSRANEYLENGFFYPLNVPSHKTLNIQAMRVMAPAFPPVELAEAA